MWTTRVVLQGVPAIAVSLDNYKALTPDGFKAGAAYIVAFVQASHLEPCAVGMLLPSVSSRYPFIKRSDLFPVMYQY